MWPQTGRSADADPSAGRGACPTTVATRPSRHRAGAGSGRSGLQPDRPGPALGRGCHPVPHRRRLAARRRGDRLVVTTCRRLVDGHHASPPSSSATRWSWRSNVVVPTVESCTTPTVVRPTRPSRSRNASPNSSSTNPSVPPATATTTPPSNRSSPPSNANWPGSTPRRSGRPEPRFAQRLFDYIEGFYNPERIQQRLGHRSPVDYEQDQSLETPCPREAGQLHARNGTFGAPLCQASRSPVRCS